jgi:uncharacterized protein (DUF1015 family)
MAEIQAFRGWRYDLGHIGALSHVVAPPYDVIDPALQDQLYKKHPANAIRLELNRDEPGDDATNNRYTRAAWFFRNWRREGVLVQEANPAIYVYYQTFSLGDRTMTRRGFIARLRLEPFGSGTVFPHEETHPSAKEDRLKLMQACHANFSPIFALFPDTAAEAGRLLDDSIAGQPALVAEDHLGVKHQLWPVTDVGRLARFTALLGDKPVFIADGHHRYETALNYRQWLATQGPLDAQHPANYVMAAFVSMADEGLVVLPTHRLFRGLPAWNASQLCEKLQGYFRTRIVGEGADLAVTLWGQMATDGQQGQLALFTSADQRWTLAQITPEGQRLMDRLAADHSPPWRQLGVAILHRLVVEHLFHATSLPTPRYVHLVEEVVHGLEHGDESAQPYPLAALVMPATVEHIQQVSQAGERMPAKSTYFYPKLLTGLVFHALDS